jgi:hypothetical protein
VKPMMVSGEVEGTPVANPQPPEWGAEEASITPTR